MNLYDLIQSKKKERKNYQNRYNDVKNKHQHSTGSEYTVNDLIACFFTPNKDKHVRDKHRKRINKMLEKYVISDGEHTSNASGLITKWKDKHKHGKNQLIFSEQEFDSIFKFIFPQWPTFNLKEIQETIYFEIHASDDEANKNTPKPADYLTADKINSYLPEHNPKSTKYTIEEVERFSVAYHSEKVWENSGLDQEETEGLIWREYFGEIVGIQDRISVKAIKEPILALIDEYIDLNNKFEDLRERIVICQHKLYYDEDTETDAYTTGPAFENYNKWRQKHHSEYDGLGNLTPPDKVKDKQYDPLFP